jgi:hypothetical protein
MHDEDLAAALDLYLAHCAQASAIASQIEAEMQEASMNSHVEAAKMCHQIACRSFTAVGPFRTRFAIQLRRKMTVTRGVMWCPLSTHTKFDRALSAHLSSMPPEIPIVTLINDQ